MIYISVIIPVRNEEPFITETLKALARQDYPKDRFELIVVDGRSTDGTRQKVEEFMRDQENVNVRLLDNPHHLSSKARNIGVRAARGKLIAIIDGHVYLPNGRLFAAMERLKEKHQALCLARPAPLDVPGIHKGMPYCIALARKSWLGHSQNSYIYARQEGFIDPISSGFAYDRSVFDRVGFFDESFDAAEDVEFHCRLKQAGIQAFTTPEFLIYSYPRPTLWALFRQQVRYGIGRARLIQKHACGFTWETPIPAMIFLFFAALPLIVIGSWRFPPILWIYSFGMGLYWLFLLGAGFARGLREKKLFYGFPIALAIWTTHMGIGWGFLKATFPLRNPSEGEALEGKSTNG